MTNIVLLGATGRTGRSILRQLSEYDHIKITAALRDSRDISRLPTTKYLIQTVVVDIDSASSLHTAVVQADIIVNAIRLRGNIAPSALVDLDKRIREAASPTKIPAIITVGGAGSLNVRNGKHFWQDAVFPKQTLPRGIAHAKLREYLKTLSLTEPWTYLIPPPAYIPTGPQTGYYQRWEPSKDESYFLNKNISYEDFATAVCHAILERWTGTHLIADQ